MVHLHSPAKIPLCHILWIKQNQPDIYRKTYKFLDPKDYINLRFTGKFAATYDSILLHWVTDNRDWITCFQFRQTAENGRY